MYFVSVQMIYLYVSDGNPTWSYCNLASSSLTYCTAKYSTG